ncbi:hypothetical protein WISP_33091 [Willisornis vidua]|uniref:Uncharacterized protein n=1 Tax=Willisornis vidua TaxID=1566151 RepID=A0ABQ9DJK5_9PASS|nr:hypothetical protein WISP_33091 [Willisornis vidua]
MTEIRMKPAVKMDGKPKKLKTCSSKLFTEICLCFTELWHPEESWRKDHSNKAVPCLQHMEHTLKDCSSPMEQTTDFTGVRADSQNNMETKTKGLNLKSIAEAATSHHNHLAVSKNTMRRCNSGDRGVNKVKIVLGYTEVELWMCGTGYQSIHAANMLCCIQNHVRSASLPWSPVPTSSADEWAAPLAAVSTSGALSP